MAEEIKNKFFERIRRDLAAYDIVVYIKGTAAIPQCGFSAAIVQALESIGVSYHAIDVQDEDGLRQALKAYADWPVTPQLYVRGTFIGGCEKVKEMQASGALKKLLTEEGLVA